MANRKREDYDVGYGKPPKSGQFKAGESGNKRGRPKGSRNLATILAAELGTRVTVTEQGKALRLTKGELMVKQLVNKAAAGDAKATPLVMLETHRIEDQLASSTTSLSALAREEDHRVMESIVARIRASQDIFTPLAPPATTEPLEAAPALDRESGNGESS